MGEDKHESKYVFLWLEIAYVLMILFLIRKISRESLYIRLVGNHTTVLYFTDEDLIKWGWPEDVW